MSKLSRTDNITLFGVIPVAIASLVAVVWLVASKPPQERPDPAPPASAEVDPAPAPPADELALPQLAPMQLATLSREQEPTSKNAITTPEGWERLPPATAESGKATFATPLGWEKIEASDLTSTREPASSTQPSTTSDSDTAVSSKLDFPTELRVWTNYQGQLMVASVLECDFKSGELKMRSDNGILRSYELFRLSDADREYLWQFSEEN